MAKPKNTIPNNQSSPTPPAVTLGGGVNAFAAWKKVQKDISVNDLIDLAPSEDCYKFLLTAPSHLKTEFTYNYFVRNERTVGQPLQQNNVPQDKQRKKVFLEKKPRYVKLTFRTGYNGQRRGVDGGIAQYSSKIVDNDGNADFLRAVFQDFNVINSVKKKLTDSFPGVDDATKKKLISDQVNKSSAPLNSYFLSTLTSVPENPEAAGIEVNGKKIFFNPYSELGEQALISSINSQYYQSITLAATMDTYSDHYEAPKVAQQSTPKKNYGYFAQPFTEPDPLTSQNNYTEMFLCGYQVDRYLVDENGAMNYEKSMLLDQAGSSSSIVFYDADVLYGVTYVYGVKAIYDTKMILPDADNGGYVTARYLLASRHSDFSSIACFKQHTPPPPGDLRFFWDSREMALHLSWCSPINTYRDIKGFKVFKRSSVSEPYQMVKMFDFNDAENRYPLPAFLANSGVVQMMPDNDVGEKSPVVSWYDHDFDPYGTQMYALVSYTAHGDDSTLSAQFQVTYNQVTGRVELELISRWGAPLAYPNLFVNRSSFFVNTMVSDGMDRLRIYFDPAARTVVRKENGVVKSSENLYCTYDSLTSTGKYVLNITSLDLLQQAQVNIKILDLSQAQVTGRGGSYTNS